MTFLLDLSQRLQLKDPETLGILKEVSWSQYEALLADWGDTGSYRVHFLDGVLEIRSPSRRHESGKTRLGSLVELYCLETDTDYFPMGSTTLRAAEQQAGGEPDESYCIGTDKEIPDLAIEVVVSSGGINRLELYRRLGVSEVWFWQNQALTIYCLRTDRLAEFADTAGYEPVSSSEILPGLNLNLVVSCMQMSSSLAAVKALRQGLQDPQDL